MTQISKHTQMKFTTKVQRARESLVGVQWLRSIDVGDATDRGRKEREKTHVEQEICRSR